MGPDAALGVDRREYRCPPCWTPSCSPRSPKRSSTKCRAVRRRSRAARDLRPDGAVERLHPDPIRGRDAVRRVRGRRTPRRRAPSSDDHARDRAGGACSGRCWARGSPTAWGGVGGWSCSNGTGRASTWARRRSRKPTAGSPLRGLGGGVRPRDPRRAGVHVAAGRVSRGCRWAASAVYSLIGAIPGWSAWRSPAKPWGRLEDGPQGLRVGRLRDRRPDRARDRLPDRAPPAGTKAPRHRCGGLSGRCRYDTPSPWACLQGPTELLPVSSSAHTTLLPWLAGWGYDELDDELRKGFEVALHGGTAAALALLAGRELAADGAGSGVRGRRVLALALAPPALAGLTLGPADRAGPRRAPARSRWRSRRGRPGCSPPRPRGRRAAGGPRARSGPTGRRLRMRGDGLALGLAQAVALIPGRVPQRGHDQRGPLAGLRPCGRVQAVVDRGAARDRRGAGCCRGGGCAAGGCRRGCARRWPPAPGAAFCSTLAARAAAAGAHAGVPADAVRALPRRAGRPGRAARVRAPVAGK